MKKILAVLILSLFLFCAGCSISALGLGILKSNSGMRYWQTSTHDANDVIRETLLVHITYLEGDSAPDYKNIAKLLQEIFK